MAPTHKRQSSIRSLFSRQPRDAEYASLHATHSDSEPDDADDDQVLREEEEREKLLAGGTSLFSRTGSIKIGKRQKGKKRRSAKEIAGMMGGKRLGMEDCDEEGDEDDEEEEEMQEKDEYRPRKPTLRRVLVIASLLLAFLVITIFGSLAVTQRARHPPPFVFSNGTHPYHRTTILISLDGVRADFLARGLTPTLSAFVNSGVSPAYMTPSFPSVTFPNHWTLATGLYPESHGIVGNSFWDPKAAREFFYTDSVRSLGREWWGGEPIWATAERQGLRAAVHMWPGSEAQGHGAHVVDVFNGTEALERKVERVLGWLDLPALQRPQFIAAYVPDVDVAGHKWGPNTTETDGAVRRVDAMLQDLFQGLESRNLTEIVNIIIVSDHGMSSTSKDRLIYLEDLVDPALIEHTDGWPLYGLRPYPAENVSAIHASIKTKESPTSHWKTYLRDTDMPARYHFSQNQRIAPLWIVPETGWTVVTEKERARNSTAEYLPRGLHGFDNLHPLMRAIFVARGPAFRHLHGEGRAYLAGVEGRRGDTKGEVRAGRVKPFGNTEVYRIVCQSLEIVEGANNATLNRLALIGEEEEEAEKEEGEVIEVPVVKVTTKAPVAASTTETARIEIQTATPIDESASSDIGISAPGDGEGNDGSAGKEEEEQQPGEMTWWQLLRAKADRLKGKVGGWWDKVWVDGKGEEVVDGEGVA